MFFSFRPGVITSRKKEEVEYWRRKYEEVGRAERRKRVKKYWIKGKGSQCDGYLPYIMKFYPLFYDIMTKTYIGTDDKQ